QRGEGLVEPNPMVGCVIARDGVRIGEGWHQRFGGPHAEIVALASATGSTAGATMYVTLEPCCHEGKTPPCSDAIIEAGIKRVVLAQVDPFPAVAGRGIERLREAGIQVDVGVLEKPAQQLNAPFRKLVQQRMPWIIAKWAMTLDGKLASHAGHSRWISGQLSRERVHELRGRVDGIMIGRRTAEVDDPLLTVRPPTTRVPARIVMDSKASLSLESRLVRTAREQPLLVAVGSDAETRCRVGLEQSGCEVLSCSGMTHGEQLRELLLVLGERRMTNVLVEGGGTLLGTCFDLGVIDEVHVFVAPKLVGGRAAPTPVAGTGLAEMPQWSSLRDPRIEVLGQDVYVSGRVVR
ncbi:MAG: bifunctional diaminohydroxyphosphoribosylaminopyrimidine deaminase/5-amino-6-(5-phosphoribosylamino)uracil reductase RibD, partial [Pirellulaceae bacterium]